MIAVVMKDWCSSVGLQAGDLDQEESGVRTDPKSLEELQRELARLCSLRILSSSFSKDVTKFPAD